MGYTDYKGVDHNPTGPNPKMKASTTLTIREQRFVNNFAGTAELGTPWRANLEADLRSYRYPHTSAVRAAVVRAMAEMAKTGSFRAWPEEAL